MVVEARASTHHPERGLPRPLSADFRELLKPSEKIVNQTGLNVVNTRAWMHRMKAFYGQDTTIDTIPDRELDALAQKHELIWFMGIHLPSPASKAHCQKWAEKEYSSSLQDLDVEKDVVGSPYSLRGHEPNPYIAKDWEAWNRMVEKLHARGKKVIIDFVPNHVAVDHPWAEEHPDFFVQGQKWQYEYDENMKRENPDYEHRFYKVTAKDGKTYYLAHGKDPNYPQWMDTLQLNYANPKVQKEMEKILLGLVDHSDGVRCDLAMLENPNTFIRTWGWLLSEEEKAFMSKSTFWETVIPEAKDKATGLGKDFISIAEVYWDTEKMGEIFDYLYADAFYKHISRIINDNEQPEQYLRNHIDYIFSAWKNGIHHYRHILYSENPDEERSIMKFGKGPSKAFAALAGLMPNAIFLLNKGQEEGHRVRLPLHVGRGPEETADFDTKLFYKRLLGLKHTRLFQEGEWQIANITKHSDGLIALQVSMLEKGIGAVVCLNISPNESSCRIPEISLDKNVLVYQLSEGGMVKNPDIQRDGGLFAKLIPWEVQVVFYEQAKRAELPLAA